MSQLRCGNGTCLDISLACNGISECGDGSDEGSQCGACARGNGACSHGCTDLPSGRRCTCPDGYQLATDGLSCRGEWAHQSYPIPIYRRRLLPR